MKLFVATLLTISSLQILFVETIIHARVNASYGNNTDKTVISQEIEPLDSRQ